MHNGSHYSIHQVAKVRDVLIDELSMLVPSLSTSVFATLPHTTLSTAVMFYTL